MTTGQRDSIAAPAAGLTIYNTTKNCIETFNGSSWAGSAHYIGESYCGGIVFFVYDNGQHGLIAAPADLNPAMPILQWDKDPTKTGATGDGINAGLMNTAISIARIIPYTPNDMFAALCCVNYSTEVDGIKYGSWYLPSKQELNLLYLQKAVVGGFSSDFYWSSTEQTYYLVWALRFSNGQWSLDEKPNWYRIRAIRAF
jgi:hypothetical protein